MAVTSASSSSNDVVAIDSARHRHEPRHEPLRYNPVTSLEKIAKSKLPPAAVHKLDWNEGTVAPAPAVSAAMIEYIQAGEGAYLKWYPELAGGEGLRAELASYCGVDRDRVLVTNGSDDALILLCQAFLERGAVTLAPTPTYEHFCVNALAGGAHLVRIDLADPFTADVEHLAAGISRHHPRLVYLVSPCNPTGIEWDPETVRTLAACFPETMFLVDEAYHEFGTVDPRTGQPGTCAQLAATHRNVIVTRTFSKAFCLASVRCGYIVAHPSTLNQLASRYNPKSVNQFAQVAALAALRERETYYRPYIERTHVARESFQTDLEARGVQVRSGGAGNFVCIRVPDGRTAELCERLEAHAIYVRDLNARFAGHVRVTVGTEMSRVADAIHLELRAMGALGKPV